MSSPMEHRIFCVPEMLEAILLELPMKDLLLSQAVCKTWKSAIETSTKLKKKLFFVADGDVWTGSYLGLLGDICFSIRSPRPDFALNPLLKGRISRLQDGRLFKAVDGGVKIPKEMLECEESWMKMLLTQPPLHQHLVAFEWQKSDGGKPFTVSKGDYAHNPQGVTMADRIHVFDEAYSKLKCTPDGGFDLCYMERDTFWPDWEESEKQGHDVGENNNAG